MIPVKLRLRNFMCYREDVPTLLLESVQIACLCGPNGAGKSALLDAITWALWGEARAKFDDDLIHLGRDEMEVELEFLVREHRYRVVRKRERASGRRAGKSVLELHVSTGPPEAGWRPITASTLRETQRAITDLLRMDYKTFINSAFLVQGRADEFTTKPPDQRKQVLADILDLAYYDEMEQRARDEARRLRGEAAALHQRITEDEAEIARRPEYASRVAQVRERLSAQEEEAQGAQARVRELRALKETLAVKRSLLEDVQRRLAGLQRDMERAQAQAAALEREASAAEALVAQDAAITEGYRALTDARQRKERLDAAARESLGLTQRRAALERAIEQRRAELASEERVARNRIEEAQKRAALAASNEPALAKARAELAALEETERHLAELRTQAETTTAQAAGLRATNDQLRQEMEQMKANIERLQAGQGVCPTCGTELGAHRCGDIVSDYERRGKDLAEAHRGNQAQMRSLQEAEARTKQEARELETRLRTERPRAQRGLAALEHAAAEASRAQAELPALEEQESAIRRRLEQRDYAPEEQAKLQEVAAALAALAYDRAAHEAADAECQKLRPFEERQRSLEESKRRLPQARQALTEAREETERRAGEAARLREQGAGLERETASLPAIERELAGAEQRHREAAAIAADLRQALGAAQRDLDLLAQRERDLAARREALTRVSDDLSAYDELATAFGARGIQALLIESALPEIEEEANRLLGRMTDNRMHLKLETQAALKSREGAKETLEIAISDELGTRSYETFSGGEAYRINLALRIALSRLLARRAGAALPTLFIDEGFGTQDPAGRDRIVEAINAIRDDFQRIIVITHIEELKEQFPARIEVEKTANGSTFWMS